MVESIFLNHTSLNTKDGIIIDLLKDGKEFLENFEIINRDLLLDTMFLSYRYLKCIEKIPHNFYKFVIAAYYIVSRHPQAFPVHESKKKFCKQFGIKPNSLDYSVQKILCELNFIKILDDKNYPYFIDIMSDIGFKLANDVIKGMVDKAMMKFLLYSQPVNSQILAEEMTTKLIFEMNIFPEELFRQFYDIIYESIEEYLKEYYEYLDLQQLYLI